MFEFIIFLALVLFVCVLISACVTDAAISPPFKNQKVGDENGNPHKQQSEGLEWVLRIAIFLAFVACAVEFSLFGPKHLGSAGWTAAFAGILILVAMQQSLYAKRQWSAIGEQIAHMRQEQRAWISITVEVTRLEAGQRLGVDFIMHNSGKTPAMIHSVNITAGIRSDYRKVDYDQIVVNHNERGWQRRENTVAPNDRFRVPLEDGHIVTREELASLEADNLGVLFFLVTVRYSDFDDGRESQALITYSLSADSFGQWKRHNYMK